MMFLLRSLEILAANSVALSKCRLLDRQLAFAEVTFILGNYQNMQMY